MSYTGHSIANIIKAAGYPRSIVFCIVVSLKEGTDVKWKHHWLKSAKSVKWEKL